MNHFQEIIFDLQADTFEATALAVFQAQAKANQIYQKYLHLLGIQPENIREIHEIPFLPINFFKHHWCKQVRFARKLFLKAAAQRANKPASTLSVAWPTICRPVPRLLSEYMGPLSQYHLL
ncbi:MAG: hypothetical protein HC913_23380, partial [Microscillaceae bacterium]|nr:hypothetical protein [Microscillaceae bacterium]